MMKRTQGFTLVEVMIAVSLGLVVVGGVMAVLLSSSAIYRSSDSRARAQENSRFALSVMQEDVRQSGYFGCFNMNIFAQRFTNQVRDDGAYASLHQVRIAGHEAGAAAWSPALAPGVGNTGHAPVNGSDVLVVRLPAGKALPLNAPMVGKSTPIPLADVTGLAVGGLAVVSDCNYADLFVVTEVPADRKVVHAANFNKGADLFKAYSNYGNASVTPLSTVTYFIAAAGNGVAGNRSLWRQENELQAEEIADGVDQMQLEFGIDTAGGDLVADKFVPADAVGTASVTAVKVSVLLRSAEANAVRSVQAYQFNGAAVTPADRRMYTPFTTTISLRNQVK